MAPDWVIVPGRSVGPLQLGMPAQDVRALVGDPERAGPAWEYVSQGFAILFDRGGQTVAAILGGDISTPDGALARLFVATTRDGIGMASDRAAVLAALGEPSSRRRDGEWENLLFPGLELSLLHDRVRWLAVRRIVARK